MQKTLSICLIFLISIGCSPDSPQSTENPHVTAHYQRGMDALDRNNFVEAEEAFRACLQIDANAHDARMLLARTYIRQQKFARAEATLQTLINLLKQVPEAKGKLSKAHLTLAQVFSYQQRFSDSTAALTSA